MKSSRLQENNDQYGIPESNIITNYRQNGGLQSNRHFFQPGNESNASTKGPKIKATGDQYGVPKSEVLTNVIQFRVLPKIQRTNVAPLSVLESNKNSNANVNQSTRSKDIVGNDQYGVTKANVIKNIQQHGLQNSEETLNLNDYALEFNQSIKDNGTGAITEQFSIPIQNVTPNSNKHLAKESRYPLQVTHKLIGKVKK